MKACGFLWSTIGAQCYVFCVAYLVVAGVRGRDGGNQDEGAGYPFVGDPALGDPVSFVGGREGGDFAPPPPLAFNYSKEALGLSHDRGQRKAWGQGTVGTWAGRDEGKDRDGSRDRARRWQQQ